MKIKDVHYVRYPHTEMWEKMDNLSRYLQLSAEFGCSKEGEELFRAFDRNLETTLAAFQKLVLTQKETEEPDDLDAIPEHWIRPFEGRMQIYLKELPEYLDIEEVCGRFEKLAERFVK